MTVLPSAPPRPECAVTGDLILTQLESRKEEDTRIRVADERTDKGTFGAKKFSDSRRGTVADTEKNELRRGSKHETPLMKVGIFGNDCEPVFLCKRPD
jgi:hypothetical protein